MTAAADELAQEMLLWLARDASRLERFFAITGFAPEDLRGALDDDVQAAAVQLAVLEYMASDEPLLLQFCADTDTPPELVARLWRTLASHD